MFLTRDCKVFELIQIPSEIKRVACVSSFFYVRYTGSFGAQYTNIALCPCHTICDQTCKSGFNALCSDTPFIKEKYCVAECLCISSRNYKEYFNTYTLREARFFSILSMFFRLCSKSLFTGLGTSPCESVEHCLLRFLLGSQVSIDFIFLKTLTGALHDVDCIPVN